MPSNQRSTYISTLIIVAQILLCALYFIGKISMFYLLGAQMLLLYSMLFFARPKIAVMLFLFIRPLLDYFRFSTSITLEMSSAINIAGIMSIVIIFLASFYILVNKINPLRAPCSKFFCLFLVVSFVATFASAYKIDGFSDWMRFVSLFFLYVLIYNLFKTKKDIVSLVSVVLCSAVIPVIVGMYQWVTNTGLIEITEYVHNTGFRRIFATFTHPNMYAFYLATLLPLCIVLYFESVSKIKKSAFGLLALGIFISLVFTFTRGAWIAVLCALFVIGALKYRKLLFIGIISIVIIVALVPLVRERMVNIFDFEPGKDGIGSFAWRIQLWQHTVRNIISKPILGHGLGSFSKFSYAVFGYYADAHNDYLRIALETGLIGLIIYVSMFFALVREAVFTYKKVHYPYFKALSLGFLSICIAYFLIGIADNLLRATVVQVYFWTFAAITFNLFHIERRMVAIPNIRS